MWLRQLAPCAQCTPSYPQITLLKTGIGSISLYCPVNYLWYQVLSEADRAKKVGLNGSKILLGDIEGGDGPGNQPPPQTKVSQFLPYPIECTSTCIREYTGSKVLAGNSQFHDHHISMKIHSFSRFSIIWNKIERCFFSNYCVLLVLHNLDINPKPKRPFYIHILQYANKIHSSSCVLVRRQDSSTTTSYDLSLQVPPFGRKRNQH